MKDRKKELFTAHTFVLSLTAPESRTAARDVTVRALEKLRKSFTLSPQLASAITAELENAYEWGLLNGIADPDPKKTKQAQDAIELLEKQRQNAAKGAAARRERGAETRERIRRLDAELRKTTSKKGVRVQKIAAAMGISTRTVERHLNAGR